MGDWFLLKSPGGGGVSRTGEAEGPVGCLQRIGEFWGGGEYFFWGAEMSTKVEIPCQVSPGKTRCFIDLAVVFYYRRSVLLPP